MDYAVLTQEQKAAMIEQRLQQYESQHFNTTLDKEIAEAALKAASDDDEQAQAGYKQQMEQADMQLGSLEVMITRTTALLEVSRRSAKAARTQR